MSAACGHEQVFSLDGCVELTMACTLPAGHGHWHEHANEAGEVLFVWKDDEASWGECPYPTALAMQSGPFQTERLGRVAS